MRLVADVGQGSLAKAGEELCGDRVEVVRQPRQTTVVLSDGLGSGVKANILATLTTKIAAGLLARGVSLEEVISTVAQTLPVCRERRIAYSTLAVVQVKTNGAARVMLLDSPPVFLVRKEQVISFPTRTRQVAGRAVEEGALELVAGDRLVLVSDGVLHAGIGGILPLGLGEEGLARHLTELAPAAPRPSSWPSAWWNSAMPTTPWPRATIPRWWCWPCAGRGSWSFLPARRARRRPMPRRWTGSCVHRARRWFAAAPPPRSWLGS